jgi:hypothetical protein
MYDPLALELQRTTQQRIRHDAERITIRHRIRGRRVRTTSAGDLGH